MKSPTHEGERQRDAALSVVRAHRTLEIWGAQLAMLSAMRERADRSGTADDITTPGLKHEDGAPWIGAAVRELRMAGVIVRAGNVVSTRPSRHAAEIKLWRLADDAKTDLIIGRLRQALGQPAPSLFTQATPENKSPDASTSGQ